MNASRNHRQYLVAALVASGATFGWNQHSAAQQPLDPRQAGVEILTRGPVHEAFAETVTFNPEPGVVVPQAPRQPIEEIAPDQRPEGANVAWIPGYWGWDDERKDFLWVSGIWRALPPGRQWIPGYWAQSARGYQWTSGYWADAQASEIQYLPAPPATVEAGPNVAASSADDDWLPGSWIWQQNRYAWRPGNWVTGQQDWQWVPAYYVWSPRGYVFVDGYWDYSVSRRGVLFAPVFFSGDVYAQNGFSYSPAIVINPGVFASHLFLRPSYGHYYFGDYYAASYATAGFSPWFSFQAGSSGYDPFFAQARWQHRRDRNWENQTQATFRNFRDNENSRPPHTWAAQAALTANVASTNNGSVVLAASLADLSKSKDSPFRFQPVSQAERQQHGLHGQEYRKFVGQRQQLEATAANTSTGRAGKTASPAATKLPKSPFVATATDQLGTNVSPPKKHVALKPNLAVDPQQQKVDGTANVTTGTTQATDKAAPQGAPTAQATGQTQRATDGQQQGNSTATKQSGSTATKQSATAGQRQGGATATKQSGSTTTKQSGSSGQQQSATTGQQPSGSTATKQSGSAATKQSASSGQQQGGSTSTKQSGSSGQQQSATSGQQQGGSTSTKQSGSSGQQQSATSGQGQGGSTSTKQSGSSGQQQSATTGQQQGGSTATKQSGSSGQQQSATSGQQQGGSTATKQSGSNGQQQSATSGQQQGGSTTTKQSGSSGQQQSTSQSQSANESTKKDKK